MNNKRKPTRSHRRTTNRPSSELAGAGEAHFQSVERYSALVNSLADAVLVSQGAITWCNDSVEDVLGYTKDELIGKDSSFFLTENVTSSEWTETVHEATRGQSVFRGTTRVKKKDGSIADIEFTAARIEGKEPPEFVTVARDVTARRLAEDALQRARDELETRVRERTEELAEANKELQTEIAERRRMEDALRRSEEHLRSLIRNALDVVVIVSEDGTIRFESDAIEKVLGYKPEEVVGQDGFNFVHPEDMAKMSALFGEVLHNPNSTVHAEVRTVHRDGSERIVEVVGQNLLGDPAVAGIVANFRDITERKRVEEERQRMEQQLELTGRLAAVGELAAGVAHELNNPLAAVQAFAQFLAARKDLDEAIRSDVDTIYREAQRATRITQNLLSFARRHKPEKSNISINEVIDRSLELHAYRMKVNNIEVKLDLDPDLPMTMADFHQMQQVFVNIITNSEQAMTDAHGKGKLVVKSRKLGSMIQATFTDDGPGIAEDHLNKIFDPFFTTKEIGRGTGLGLSICFGIVHEHGGNLYASSKRGEGATFVVEIPISSEAETTPRQPARTLPLQP